jgi:hypothetical protein
MPSHKKLAPFIVALIAIIGVFAYAERERIAPTVPDDVPVVVGEVQSAANIPDRVAATLVANAALKVGETTYPLNVSQGGTVIDAMRTLAAASTFAFTGRDYPELGFFVDSINGKKNADGRYWILYLNGLSASAGASTVMVSAGDTVEWKYEKGY